MKRITKRITCPCCKGAKSFPVKPGSKLWCHGWAGIRCPECKGKGSVRP